MNKNEVTFHISAFLEFNKDADVEKIEKELGLKAHKLTYLKDAEECCKTAKIWYKTKDCNSILAGETFDEFIESIKDKFKNLPNILERENGGCTFSIIFTEVNEFPSISLSQKTIETLSNWHADFDVDFICDYKN